MSRGNSVRLVSRRVVLISDVLGDLMLFLAEQPASSSLKITTSSYMRQNVRFGEHFFLCVWMYIFFVGGIAPIECYESSNWKKLKRFAPKKSKNDLVDGSGAHFKVGDASRSGARSPLLEASPTLK